MMMFRRGLIAAAFAGVLALSASAQEIIVRTRPPHPLAERRVRAPGRGYVWTPGYHRWDGRAFVWAPGAWVQPPRAHARWEPAHWVRRHHEWVFVGGHWR